MNAKLTDSSDNTHAVTVFRCPVGPSSWGLECELGGERLELYWSANSGCWKSSSTGDAYDVEINGKDCRGITMNFGE